MLSRWGARLSPRTRADRRADRWASAIFAVAAIGMLQGVLGLWGGRSWFALEVPDDPVAGWLSFSWLPLIVFGLLVLWSGVVGLRGAPRREDRHGWIRGWGGLAIVAAVSLLSAYAASRNGVALYEDRIVWRQAVLAPLETTRDAEVAGLNVVCEMVRRPRSLRANDLIDRPLWTLSLRDGRVLDIGGVRGAGVGGLDQDEWLAAMRRLGRYPVRAGRVEPRCVERVVARFPETDRAFVRSLFGR